MKNNSKTTFIVVAGLIILIIFVMVMSINLMPNYESNSYFVKVDNEMTAKIESMNVSNGKLTIITSGNPIEYCVKQTRTTPSNNALCWNEITENVASISILSNKKYYVWIKDKNSDISNYLIVNAKQK